MIIYLEHMALISKYDLSSNPVYLNHDLGSGHLLVTPTCFLCFKCLIIPFQCPYLGIHVIPEKQMLPITREVTSDLG